MTPDTRGSEAAVSFDPGSPYAIEHLTRALTRLTRNATSYFESLPVQTFFAPQGDRWSPADHVRHLRKSSAPLKVGFGLPVWLLRLMYGEAKAPSRTFEVLRSDYRSALAAGGQAGRFAPTPQGAPADPERRRAEILSRWGTTNEAVTTAWGKWRSLDLDRARLPHPLLGKLTAREMAMFTVYHTSHHLTLVADRLA
ncbi:MAG: DinB family protein [Gemmatimonadaceae bacterium]